MLKLNYSLCATAILLIALATATTVTAASLWTAVNPGGDTICASGGAYTFFYRKGTSGNLTVFMEGGGACYDAVSCSLPIYTSSIDESLPLLDSDPGIMGDNTKSPILADTQLFIPYCTGDVHAGNNTASYGIHHKGRVNVDTALTFIQSIIPNPHQVNVIGCSAGSLGAFLNAPFVFEKFPHAVKRVWGDSEIGIVSATQWADAWSNWGLTLPEFVPGLESSITKVYTNVIAGYIVAQSAKYYPDAFYAAYTSNADSVQTAFYNLGGGFDSWTDRMRFQFNSMKANATNIAYYIASGSNHCTSDKDTIWSVTTNNVPLYEWVSEVIHGAALPPVVDCSPNC